MIGQLLGRTAGPLTRLTDREREVLHHVAQGRSNTAIAQALYVSEKAVGKHIGSIFGKLDLAPSDDEKPAGARSAGLPAVRHPGVSRSGPGPDWWPCRATPTCSAPGG